MREKEGGVAKECEKQRGVKTQTCDLTKEGRSRRQVGEFICCPVGEFFMRNHNQ